MFYHLSCAQSLRGSPINDDEYCVLTNYRDHNYRELVRVVGKPYRNDDDDICGYTKADRIIPHIDDVNDDVKNKVNGSESSDYYRKNLLVQSQQQQQQQQQNCRITDENNDETIDSIDDDDDCDLHYYLSHAFSTCRLYSLQVGVQGNVVHHHHHIHHNHVL